MEILFSILFFLLGVTCPLFSAVLYYLSLESVNILIEKDYKAAQRLRLLKIEFDELINSFQILELISYFISFTLIVIFVENYLNFVFSNSIYVFLFTASYLILIFFIRYFFQSIGIRFADNLANKLSFPIYYISVLFKPIVLIFKLLNKKIVGTPDFEESRDEISELVESAHEEGAIDSEEYRILKNIMNFSEILVSDVMTPRTVMFTCSGDKSVDELISVPELQMYSRFPIWEGDTLDDGILGYVMSRDVLLAAINGKGAQKIRDFVREIYFIPENAELDTALERFLNRRQHMFMVIDEYGGIEGLLTMEDVLETMLGVEIVDEVDKVVDLRQLAKQRRDSRIASL